VPPPPRPVRSSNPTAKLKDAAEAPQLSFQWKAVQEFHSRQLVQESHSRLAVEDDPPSPSTVDADLNGSPSAPPNKRSISSVDGSDAEDGIVNRSMPRMFHFRRSIQVVLLTMRSL
jgi:hypothetical protein